MKKTIIQNKLLYPEILWERPVHFYKARAGKVLIIAGSKGTSGAAILASEAVFRSGTGILTLGFPDRIKDFYKDILPEAMTLALPSTLSDSLAKRGHDEIVEQSKSCDVALIGPGVSTNAETVQLVWDLIFDLNIPIVLDDDGLIALAVGIEVMRKKESEQFMKDYFKKIKDCLILTPNTAEAHRILKAMSPIGLDNKELAQEYIEKHKDKAVALISESIGCVTVIKGHDATVGSREHIITNKSDGPKQDMSGESGVLSGIVTSFIAQNPDKPLEATATAVYLARLAGNLAQSEAGERPVAASDVIRYLPAAIKKAELENLNHGDN